MVERYTNLAPLPFLYLLRLTQLSLPEIRVDSHSGSGRRDRRSALHCDKAVTDIRSRPRRSSCRRNPRDTGSDVIRRRLGTSRRLGRPHPRRHLQHHTVPLRVPVETTAISHRSHTRRFNGHFRWNWFSGCPLTSFLNSIQARRGLSADGNISPQKRKKGRKIQGNMFGDKANPLRARFGPAETTLTQGAPAGCLTPEGSRGPTDTEGPGVAYSLPPFDGPGIKV